MSTSWTDVAERLDRHPQTPAMMALYRLADALSLDAEQIAERIDEIEDVAVASIEVIETALGLEVVLPVLQEGDR